MAENNSITSNPEYVSRKTAQLHPSARNARTHSSEQIAKISASISEFGFLNPVIIDAENNVIAGHGRLEAAKSLGMDSVPCLLTSHLTDAQCRAYMLADNRMALDADWNESILADEIRGLIAVGFDVDFTGFESDELALLLADKPSGESDEDDAPEVSPVPIARLGETWLLGAHRVRCGDSENPDDVAALLNGAKPHLMVTDPPYGVVYDANWRNDAMRADGTASDGRAIGKVLNDDKADWRKAWALFPGDVVYDPFLGSGTTVIAAETEARICYGMELNPSYVDVIIKRWQDFTGKQAARESDGVLFNSLFITKDQVAA